jgi:hypothetical protein
MKIAREKRRNKGYSILTNLCLVYSKYGTIIKRIITDRKAEVLQMNSDLMHPSSH